MLGGIVAKLTVAIFFLIAVVVLLLIRYAARGMKAGYDYVQQLDQPRGGSQARQICGKSDDPETAENHKHIDWLLGSLSMQKTFIEGSRGFLPEKAKDAFSKGYIFGYCDAFLQFKGLLDQQRGFTIIAIVLMELLGKDEGAAAAGYVLRNQDNPEVIRGMTTGGNELMAWLGKKADSPLGWAGHYLDKNA
jgi:hypothetical protein